MRGTIRCSASGDKRWLTVEETRTGEVRCIECSRMLKVRTNKRTREGTLPKHHKLVEIFTTRAKP